MVIVNGMSIHIVYDKDGFPEFTIPFHFFSLFFLLVSRLRIMVKYLHIVDPWVMDNGKILTHDECFCDI